LYDPTHGSIHESIAVFLCITAVILAAIDFAVMVYVMIKSKTINHLAIDVNCAIFGFSWTFLGCRWYHEEVHQFRADVYQGFANIFRDILDFLGLEMHPIVAYIPGFVGMLLGASWLYIIASRTVVQPIKRRLAMWDERQRVVDSPPNTKADVVPSRRKLVVRVQDRTTRLETSRE